MSEQLLPCPFCGGEARYLLADLDDDGYCVECQQCWASSRVHLSLMDDARPIVAAAWNRRVPAPAAGVPLSFTARELLRNLLNQAFRDGYLDPDNTEPSTEELIRLVDAQPQPGQVQEE